MRIGTIIIFILSELSKAKFFILCDLIFLVMVQGKFEIDLSPVGVKELTLQLNPAMSNSVISNTPLSRTVSLSPWLKSTPAISNFVTFRRNTGQHQSGSAVKAPPDKMYWKAEKCIDVFLVTKAKSNWLDLLLRMKKATSCRYLLILGIKLLLQKFDANLAISNYFSIPLRVRDSEVLLYVRRHLPTDSWGLLP